MLVDWAARPFERDVKMDVDKKIKQLREDKLELWTKIKQLQAENKRLREVCRGFMEFAWTDLPKGFAAPEKWMDRLKAKTHEIKQALKQE